MSILKQKAMRVKYGNIVSIVGFSLMLFSINANAYLATADDAAKAIKSLVAAIKNRNIISSNMVLIKKIGQNIDGYLPVINKYPKQERIEILLSVAQDKKLADTSQSLRLNRALLNEKIKEQDLIDAIRRGNSLKPLLAQLDKNVTDIAKDRWDIAKPPYRFGRLSRQEKAKDQLREKRHSADYKARWEKANNAACKGQVHHIMPLQLVYGKNQKVEKLFDNCGEPFFADSPDYIHGHRNTVCILDGHAKHPSYTSAIEKSLSSVPLSLSREETCKKIGQIRNCFRRGIENMHRNDRVNEIKFSCGL